MHFAWFGCPVFLVMIPTFDYAIQSNLHPDNRRDISRMWYTLAGFVHAGLDHPDASTVRPCSREQSGPKTETSPKFLEAFL